MSESSPNTAATPGDISGLRERIIWLLKNHWEGNQRSMARDLGLSQPSISRIERGIQRPGVRLVSAIAAHPEISDAWLYTGQGEPIVATPTKASVADWSLPVATRILPGKPKDYPNRLSGTISPVIEFINRVTCYYLHMSERVALVPNEDTLIDKGDLLVMDTDERIWIEDEDFLLGRICVARVKLPKGIRCTLGGVGLGPVFHPMERLDFSSSEDVSIGCGPDAAADPATYIQPPIPLGPWPLPTRAVVAVSLLMVRNFGQDAGDRFKGRSGGG